ncbi:unnamed protein product [Choristocarpus tenellus]
MSAVVRFSCSVKHHKSEVRGAHAKVETPPRGRVAGVQGGRRRSFPYSSPAKTVSSPVKADFDFTFEDDDDDDKEGGHRDMEKDKVITTPSKHSTTDKGKGGRRSSTKGIRVGLTKALEVSPLNEAKSSIETAHAVAGVKGKGTGDGGSKGNLGDVAGGLLGKDNGKATSKSSKTAKLSGAASGKSAQKKMGICDEELVTTSGKKVRDGLASSIEGNHKNVRGGITNTQSKAESNGKISGNGKGKGQGTKANVSKEQDLGEVDHDATGAEGGIFNADHSSISPGTMSDNETEGSRRGKGLHLKSAMEKGKRKIEGSPFSDMENDGADGESPTQERVGDSDGFDRDDGKEKGKGSGRTKTKEASQRNEDNEELIGGSGKGKRKGSTNVRQKSETGPSSAKNGELEDSDWDPENLSDSGTGINTKKARGRGGGTGTAKGKGKGKGIAVMSTAKPTNLATDVGTVLKSLRKLRASMQPSGRGNISGGGVGGGKSVNYPTLRELGLEGNVKEVKEMLASNVMDEIEVLAIHVAESILSGKGFGYAIPTRSASNQRYIPELDRIMLADKVSQRNFVSTSMARKTAITTRVMELVHQVLGKGIHITKRDMFYTDVKLFKEQGESDTVLDDVACMVGCTRSCLNVVASEKGLVVGRVTFVEDGDLIDCTRMGVGGKAIPPYIDKIADIQSDADFILLVEKEAAYMRMAEDRFYQKYPCIVITAKGQPDVATRLFLKRLKRELNIPVLGLVDSDPYGLKILSVYMSGSKNMSYDSASLTTPDIKWLGVRPSDLDRYSIPEQCRLDMTEHDIKTGKELLQVRGW